MSSGSQFTVDTKMPQARIIIIGLGACKMTAVCLAHARTFTVKSGLQEFPGTDKDDRPSTGYINVNGSI